jgi:hypothetical protein
MRCFPLLIIKRATPLYLFAERTSAEYNTQLFTILNTRPTTIFIIERIRHQKSYDPDPLKVASIPIYASIEAASGDYPREEEYAAA